VDWNSLRFDRQMPVAVAAGPQAFGLTDCQMALGYVVFDVVSLAVGAVGLRSTVQAETVAAMAQATAPVLTQIEKSIALMTAEGVSLPTRARGVFDILQTIYDGGCLGAVWDAFTGALTWWDMILYGVTGTATVLAALATDGVAFVAEVVILLAATGVLVSDLAKAVQACSITPESGPQEPTRKPGADPFPFEPTMAMRTQDGHMLTIVNNGGLHNDAVAIQTDRRQVGQWEKFTLVPIDAQSRTFALKTSNGTFLTAVHGGGMGGPDDASSPVHTDVTGIGPQETLVFEELPDGTYAICTTSGYYLTATNGGGWGESANSSPIHTDATSLGPWETFTLLSVPTPDPFESATAIRTRNGDTFTIVNNGGLRNDALGIQTDRRVVGPWEKFTIVPIDAPAGTYALKTSNGNFLTAVNGGGIGGPDDTRSPVHTNLSAIGPQETLIFEKQSDATYAICTTTGYYLTATNGGGWGESANNYPLHTDATTLGPWETFTLLGVPGPGPRPILSVGKPDPKAR
jgi:hypothetical protein